MDQVLQQQYADIMSANALHTRNRNRWSFLLDSYVGGDEYRRGQYLTKYVLETPSEYSQRLATTPLENHCKSIVATYISFLFREEPEREMGSLSTELALEDFLDDCDWEGRDLDSFMKQAAIWANVFGHSWILMSKPDIGAVTRADELAEGVRPYLNLLTPLSVTDWRWSRRLNGSYELTYLKYVEDANDSQTTIKEWHLDRVTTTVVDHKNQTVLQRLEEVNGLGCIPAVIVYAQASPVRGIGLSTISDLADVQRFIYNMTSEAEQAVRLGLHPSLVKTEATQAGSGAGSIIHMPEHLDPNLKPYVLEFTGSDISNIYTAINHAADAIDKMANTGSIRATEAREMSGVSREVEFQLLNARLSEMADNIELAEEQLWQFYALYQGYTWDGEIEYPDSFSVRDTGNDIKQYIDSLAAVQDPIKKQTLEWAIMTALDIEGPEHEQKEDLADTVGYEFHKMMNPETGATIEVATEQQHLDAIAAGYTLEARGESDDA
jgi:hypothetical protein